MADITTASGTTTELANDLTARRSSAYNSLFYGFDNADQITNLSDKTWSKYLEAGIEEDRTERDRARSLADFDRTLAALDLSKSRQVEQAGKISYNLASRQYEENYRDSLNRMYASSLQGFWS